MSRVLDIDDLTVGMLLTVVQGKKTVRTVPTPSGPLREVREDEKFNGKVLRLKAIDYPYIVVEHYFYKDKKMTNSLDVGKYKLGRVSTEYVKELQPQYLEFVEDSDLYKDFWVFDQELGDKKKE
jgi:hypothetical protein